MITNKVKKLTIKDIDIYRSKAYASFTLDDLEFNTTFYIFKDIYGVDRLELIGVEFVNAKCRLYEVFSGGDLRRINKLATKKYKNKYEKDSKRFDIKKIFGIV